MRGPGPRRRDSSTPLVSGTGTGPGVSRQGLDEQAALLKPDSVSAPRRPAPRTLQHIKVYEQESPIEDNQHHVHAQHEAQVLHLLVEFGDQSFVWKSRVGRPKWTALRASWGALALLRNSCECAIVVQGKGPPRSGGVACRLTNQSIVGSFSAPATVPLFAQDLRSRDDFPRARVVLTRFDGHRS
jgi:hypothetical protein